MRYSPEGRFLQTLFDRLNASGIPYAVMRNYEMLPYSTGGSDIDIFVPPDNSDQAQQVLLDCISRSGGTLVGVVKTFNYFGVCVLGNLEGNWWGTCIEIYGSISYKSSAPLLDIDCLNEIMSVHNGISVMNRDVGNTLGFIKEIMAHDKFRTDKPQYIDSARNLSLAHIDLYERLFSSLGQRALSLLPCTVDYHATKDQSIGAIRSFRRAVLVHALLSDAIGFVRKRVVHEFSRITRYLYPPGAVIAILGVDGAGKSTVINAILPALNAATHNAVVVRHLRPTVLPPLARLKGKKNLPAGPVLEPHGSTPSGTLGSLFRLAYLTVDYMLGYWLWTRPKIARQPTVVIFDRYAYDMALDPRRFRIGLSSRVAGWFTALAPKPDLIICLHGDPEVLAARKQELSSEETRRQVDALRAFAAREPQAVLIATDTGIEETRDRVLHALSECLRARAEKSL